MPPEQKSQKRRKGTHIFGKKGERPATKRWIKKAHKTKYAAHHKKNPFPQRQEIDLIFRRLTEREEEAWKNALFFVSLQSLLPLE